MTRRERAAHDTGSLVFADRGVVDCAAFCRHSGDPLPAFVARACTVARYWKVFVLDLVLPFDERHATGRIGDEQAARAVQCHLRAAWIQFGQSPVDVPVLPVGERVEFVLSHLAVHDR